MNVGVAVFYPKAQRYLAVDRRAATKSSVQHFFRAVLAFTVVAIGETVERTRRSRRRSATIRALSQLSDHTLKDIGVHRDEIFAVADEASQSPQFPPASAGPVASVVTQPGVGTPAANDIHSTIAA